jgi:hypothetical protein
MIELLIITLGVSACLSIIYLKPVTTIQVRAQVIESELVLTNYLNYKPSKYNETFSLLLNQFSDLFNKDSYLFNESVRVIKLLNNNNHFIVYANISNNELLIYDQQASVCLTQAQLSTYEFTNGRLVYGSWKREADLKC